MSAIGTTWSNLVFAQRMRALARRADRFLDLMDPQPGNAILDLGGEIGLFMGLVSPLLPRTVTITVADTDPRVQTVSTYGFAPVVLDPAHERLPFADGAFDVVVCHNVSRQSAEEIRRVGRSYLVETPWRRRTDLRTLFTDAEVTTERVFGLPWSLVAYRRHARFR